MLAAGAEGSFAMSSSQDFKRRLSVLNEETAEPFSGVLALPEIPIQVLVVDDEALNRRLLRRHLQRAGMEVVEADNGADGIAKLYILKGEVDVIILDLLMPGMSGQEMLQWLRSTEEFSRVPVLVASNLASIDTQEELLEMGASDYLNKPVRPRELVSRVRNLARLRRSLEQLDDVERVILTLARTVEAKDSTTEGHCERLSLLSVALGEQLGLEARMLRALDRGGVLHDIGKVGIPDVILFKPGALDAREWKSMRLHPEIGDEMLAPLRSLEDVRPIVRHHHERWDGSGYPDGLAGSDIPITARILQIVDAYDALRSTRPYKRAFTHDEATGILRQECETGLWDPRLLDVALELFTSYRLPVGIVWS
jgi:putative two-component system response regulator